MNLNDYAMLVGVRRRSPDLAEAAGRRSSGS